MRQNNSIGASINSNIESRSAATPQNDNFSTSAESNKKLDSSTDDGSRVQIPTPVSSDENKDSNIQFVEV